MIIALDIDSIICDPISNVMALDAVDNCVPYVEAVESLTKLKLQGHEILIFTKRDPSLCMNTEAWLQRNKIPYDYIVLGKPRYDVILDFNAHKFESWESFMNCYKTRLESK